MTDLTPEETRFSAARGAAHDFARKCRSVEEHVSVHAETALGGLINDLMTELWDSGFSATEIRAAFEAASRDVSRYAGPHERNGTGLRGTSES